MKTVRHLLLIALLTHSAFGQTLAPSGPSSAKAGTTITVTIVTGGGTTIAPAAQQWTLNLPAGFTAAGAAIGAAASAASKVLACNPATTLCLYYGMNQTVVANGVVASHTVQIPASASGNYTISLTGVYSVNKDGGVVTTTASPFSLSVFGKSDLNNDGITNGADVMLMVNQVTGGTCTDDQNGDGICTVNDVFAVVLKALGL